MQREVADPEFKSSTPAPEMTAPQVSLLTFPTTVLVLLPNPFSLNSSIPRVTEDPFNKSLLSLLKVESKSLPAAEAPSPIQQH